MQVGGLVISKCQNTENIRYAATLWLHSKARRLAMKQELKENGTHTQVKVLYVDQAISLYVCIKARHVIVETHLTTNSNKDLQRHFTHTSTSITHKLNTLSTLLHQNTTVRINTCDAVWKALYILTILRSHFSSHHKLNN